ncbi:MAG TPA: trypsin-like peptidase domain-containing protein [Steroidobacteraceae bacterium]|nr:trypsin-like peptidase domain-containing protein [Steroidobacteraceae bacterium]
MRGILRALAFAAASIVSGLALAFVLVAWHPELVRRGPPAPAAPTQVAATTPAAAGSATAPAALAAAQGPPPARALPPIPAPQSYAAAVRRAAPAGVHIYTTRTGTEQIAPAGFAALFGELSPLYRSRTERSLGSGVIVDAEGHIATNNHVIAGADKVLVQLADRRIAHATIVGRDPDSDLALLKIDLPHLPVMPFGHSDRLQVGDVVLAIGDPLGLSQTVTHGIVSATGRGQLGLATFENFIQTDAAINPGNSGGALINAQGELVGINTAIIARNQGDGIGFAIPVNMVRGVIHELIAHGKVVRGWIGIIPEDFDDEQAAQLGLARGGVVLYDLYADSPAVNAGLRPGDILTAIDGSALRSSQDTLARIAESRPGTTVQVTGIRGRQVFQVNLKVAQRPQNR